jgi:hypothetical protein
MTDPSHISGRILEALRSIIRNELPQLTYLGEWEYSVFAISADGSTADLTSALPTIPLGNLNAVPLAPGLLGESVHLAVGTTVRVRFVNADPSRPEIVGGNKPPVTSNVQATAELDLNAPIVKIAGGGPPVARYGDGVQVLLTDVMVAGLGLKAGGSAVVVGPMSPITVTVPGTVVTGSLRVSSG